MVGCVLNQLNPLSSTFLAVKRPRLPALAFFTIKNVELLGLYRIQNV